MSIQHVFPWFWLLFREISSMDWKKLKYRSRLGLGCSKVVSLIGKKKPSVSNVRTRFLQKYIDTQNRTYFYQILHLQPFYWYIVCEGFIKNSARAKIFEFFSEGRPRKVWSNLNNLYLKFSVSQCFRACRVCSTEKRMSDKLHGAL